MVFSPSVMSTIALIHNGALYATPSVKGAVGESRRKPQPAPSGIWVLPPD